MMNESREPKRHRSFGETMIAIAWSFIGLRRKSDFEHDAEHLNPVHVIVAALIGVLLFIGLLVLVVHYAVGK
jgi:predicted PurR-regulated permease PerM